MSVWTTSTAGLDTVLATALGSSYINNSKQTNSSAHNSNGFSIHHSKENFYQNSQNNSYWNNRPNGYQKVSI